MNQSVYAESRFLVTAFRATPVMATVAALAVINWFICGLVAMFIGGDSLGTFPSEAGFVVSSHGIDTRVNEVTWIFSLVYSYLTIGFTPLVISTFCVYHLLWRVPPLGRCIALSFFCLPAIAWLYLVSRDTLHSIHAYLAFTGN